MYRNSVGKLKFLTGSLWAREFEDFRTWYHTHKHTHNSKYKVAKFIVVFELKMKWRN